MPREWKSTLQTNCMPQRYAFAIMGFFATAIVYMMRRSLNLALPHMVNQTAVAVLYDPAACPEINISNGSNITPGFQGNRSDLFDWDLESENKLIGAFHIGYIMTQFVGGMAADKNGGKWILNMGMLLASILTLLVPVVAKFGGSDALFYVRIFTGIASGPSIPALVSMMSKWIPHNERAHIGSIIFTGALIGNIASSYFAELFLVNGLWEPIFYTFGAIGVTWSIIWFFLCNNTPNTHRCIGEHEKRFLNEHVTSLIRTEKYALEPLPWGAFLRSLPILATTIAYIGFQWGLDIGITQLPQYMENVLRFNIKSSKALYYLPLVCTWISALIIGFICDFAIKRGCSIKTVRKLFTTIASIGSAICIILTAYSGCNPTLALVWLFMAMIFMGAYYSGVVVNVLDITPNYSGTMIAIVDNVGINVAYFLQPILNQVIVSEGLVQQWRVFLWIAFCVVILTGIFYLVFAQDGQEWWDDVIKNGYPANWKHGLLPTEAFIDLNGEKIFDIKKSVQLISQ